jgi:hypothetical protein
MLLIRIVVEEVEVSASRIKGTIVSRKMLHCHDRANYGVVLEARHPIDRLTSLLHLAAPSLDVKHFWLVFDYRLAPLDVPTQGRNGDIPIKDSQRSHNKKYSRCFKPRDGSLDAMRRRGSIEVAFIETTGKH